MSKYIVEIKPEYEDSFKGLMILGAKDSNLFVDTLAVESLEELNSDYINEHFGELQDEAYEQGYADGKNIIDMGCEGCKYTVRFADDEPCKSCSNCYKNQYTPMPKEDDRIEVGNIVDVYGKIGVVTYAYKNTFNVMMYDGSTGRWRREDLKKTGKHYDIQSILEAMRQ